MPVQPMYGMGNDGFGMGGGMGAWWLLVLLFAMGGWGNNRGNNNSDMLPYLMMNNNNTNATNCDSAIQRGFDQQAVIGGINGVQSAVINGNAANQQALCSGFAGVEAGATNRQMANMQQMFGLSQQFAQCCCDQKLATVVTRSLLLLKTELLSFLRIAKTATLSTTA